MRYDNPELRELLAAEYVLGTLPWRSRRRFELAMNEDPALAKLVSDWAERFSAIDRATPGEEPHGRVWRAIDARVAAPALRDQPSAAPMQSLRAALRFWRSLAVAASAVAAALIVYVATQLVQVAPPLPQVIAVLTDQNNEPSWIATAGPRKGEIAVAALRPQQSGAGHSFELWGIAGGAPRSLGLLQPLLRSSEPTQHKGSARRRVGCLQ